jgi:hypothetical protein
MTSASSEIQSQPLISPVPTLTVPLAFWFNNPNPPLVQHVLHIHPHLSQTLPKIQFQLAAQPYPCRQANTHVATMTTGPNDRK